MPFDSAKPSSLRPFFLWLAAFYGAWLAVVVCGDHWRTLAEHWPIAVTMAFGSYVAGSTPMGGGTVGFPILVLAFDQPATLGRDFSFAVQSIGMTSATIWILCRRTPLEWGMLRWALLGSAAGTPLGVLFVAPLVPALWIKVLFAVVWGSFGIMQLWRMDEVCANEGETPAAHRFDRWAGLACGLGAGATVAAITGVGIDMVLYVILVLLCHADLKIAIPTSVVIMSFTSLVGMATKLAVTGVQPDVFGNWLAAAPVVALGAPLGAFIVARIGRRPTLTFVSLLCMLQFLWTMSEERGELIAAAVAAVVVFNLGFEALYLLGHRLDRRDRTSAAKGRAA